MTQNFNKTSEKEKRRQLRKDQTYCEKIVWHYLRDRRLSGLKFRRQHSIDQFVIDFYCPELKLAIELDGSIHDEPDKKNMINAGRFGVTFVRITNDEFMSNVNMVLKRLMKQ